ncbi:sporulation protein [Rossellomorea vietnamensis]|uniref:Sporulation protein n=1 Tax=Rossellomorea vietnamensis TaxID=218284 RepID=A0A5D4MEQ9_9BACI|nr:sporulation protein [Rossellomorea vietnamensis]TYS00345.1 sporulation protein [Rossellomorea vietnamensis]
MLLRKYMSLLGIGAAKIDLQLPKEEYCPGEVVKGVFNIEGGTVDQRINRIECELVRIDKLAKVESLIDSATILTSTVIYAEEKSPRNFTFKIPENLSPSTKTNFYQFKTRLSFKEGIESKDQDIITISHMRGC